MAAETSRPIAQFAKELGINAGTPADVSMREQGREIR
jgi:hypothetical protein